MERGEGHTRGVGQAINHNDPRSRYRNDSFYKSLVDFLANLMSGRLISKAVIIECIELAEEINRERQARGC